MNCPRYMIVEKACCGTCIHYRQHYILTEQCRPYPLRYGHCGTPRVKHRALDETCPYWENSEQKVASTPLYIDE